MKIQTPSIKTITDVLSRANYPHVTYKWASVLWALMRASVLNTAKDNPEEAHRIIDIKLDNHGVESFRVKVRGQVRTLYYSNTGDTYGATVMRWDWIDGGQRRVIWLVGCWGDIAEKYPEVIQ